MKESIFNKYINLPDGVTIVFNSLSCGLAVIDRDYHEIQSLLPNIDKNSLSCQQLDVYKKAIDGGFLVADEFDEILDFKTKCTIKKFDLTHLNLTIAPTLLCNFKCVYCYEENKSGVMTKITEDNIIKFIEKNVQLVKTLHVGWYGGEPLLAFESISHLSEKIIKLCNINNISYTSSIITNGSLINESIIRKFKEYYIDEIQITLDGPPRIHEIRRISKNNKSNFYAIIKNINKLLAENLNVVIRINIDKNNEAYLDELFTILEKSLINRNVTIYFGQVKSFTKACSAISEQCLDNSEFAKNLLEYYSLLFKYDIVNEKTFPYPESMYNYCSSQIFNSYVIDPKGYLYKCWNLIGDKEHSIGNINDLKIDLTSYKHGKWLCKDVINVECEKCNILPICLGGCPALRQKIGEKCDLIKYNIDDILIETYKQLKEAEK